MRLKIKEKSHIEMPPVVCFYRAPNFNAFDFERRLQISFQFAFLKCSRVRGFKKAFLKLKQEELFILSSALSALTQ